eukprot:4882-Chlamydomonas_euryale.AAC.1
MLRSCLRAVDALEQLEGAAGCTPFRNFLTKTVKGPPAMREKYAQVCTGSSASCVLRLMAHRSLCAPFDGPPVAVCFV